MSTLNLENSQTNIRREARLVSVSFVPPVSSKFSKIYISQKMYCQQIYVSNLSPILNEPKQKNESSNINSNQRLHGDSKLSQERREKHYWTWKWADGSGNAIITSNAEQAARRKIQILEWAQKITGYWALNIQKVAK